jgi:hypothetical protein
MRPCAAAVPVSLQRLLLPRLMLIVCPAACTRLLWLQHLPGGACVGCNSASQLVVRARASGNAGVEMDMVYSTHCSKTVCGASLYMGSHTHAVSSARLQLHSHSATTLSVCRAPPLLAAAHCRRQLLRMCTPAATRVFMCVQPRTGYSVPPWRQPHTEQCQPWCQPGSSDHLCRPLARNAFTPQSIARISSVHTPRGDLSAASA